MTGLIVAAAVGYLLGSIPFGLILTRLAGLGDIRRIGSGNIGATNVLRTGNKSLAGLTVALDALKGVAAVLVGAAWGPEAAVVAGGAAVIGHMFPVWLGFHGGKGVATALGVLLAVGAWPVAIIAAVVWLAAAAVLRYSSAAALLAAVVAAVVAPLLVDAARAGLIAGIALLIILRHHQNIRRLLAGTESRISFGKG